MPVVPVVNIENKQVESLALNDGIFSFPLKEPVVHQYIVTHLNNMRSGTASTKSRADVSGGGKKPWRQKGTGRARAGTNRSPIWRGGGIIFGPMPRSYATALPKKMRSQAIKCVLSEKLKSGDMIILDRFQIENGKTRNAMKILSNLGVDNKKVLVVISDIDKNLVLAAKNIPWLNIVRTERLNAYDILLNDKLVFMKDAILKIQEVISHGA